MVEENSPETGEWQKLHRYAVERYAELEAPPERLREFAKGLELVFSGLRQYSKTSRPEEKSGLKGTDDSRVWEELAEYADGVMASEDPAYVKGEDHMDPRQKIQAGIEMLARVFRTHAQRIRQVAEQQSKFD